MGLGSDQPIPFIISWFVGVVFDLTDHEFSNYRLTIDDIASGWEQNYGQISDRAQGNTYTNFLGYFIFLLILYFSKIKITPNQFDSINCNFFRKCKYFAPVILSEVESDMKRITLSSLIMFVQII